MQEKTFYKSNDHWFASKEDAEEWERRLEEEQDIVYEELMDKCIYNLLDPIYTEKGHKEWEAQYEAAKSEDEKKRLEKRDIRLQMERCFESLSPKQFFRVLKGLKEFHDIYLENEYFYKFSDNYTVRTQKLPKPNLLDWLREHEIKAPTQSDGALVPLEDEERNDVGDKVPLEWVWRKAESPE
tara:strand:+ start:156 stop:704 length:549 start_codon:yes stop_codon:yes gene_type:complete